MDKAKARLERMRPILQAMENSIDRARAQRTRGDEPEEIPADVPAEAEAPEVPGPVDPDTATRMRARPRRPRAFDEPR